MIAVRAHQLVPFADAESGLRQEILAKGGASLSTALGHVVRSARVELDPRYGTWSPTHGVAAPTPPKPAFVLNTSDRPGPRRARRSWVRAASPPVDVVVGHVRHPDEPVVPA